ncbi:MAG: hypothetical protein J2P15_09565 [Micromonosporaceae bacterium]|nr:hypothetical protein [Micromonosporaceae bacterium]
MTEPEDLGDRVSALEGEVRDLSWRVRAAEQDAAAVRVLAGGADRDVSEYRIEFRAFKRATTASFNAMRADLADLRSEVSDFREHVDARFESVDARFVNVDARFDQVDARFVNVDARFDQVDRNFLAVRGVLDAQAAGLQQITNMLTILIERDGGQPTPG